MKYKTQFGANEICADLIDWHEWKGTRGGVLGTGVYAAIIN
jgi:hypothetical protein